MKTTKLYNVPRGTWIRVKGEIALPPGALEIKEGDKIFFHHVDGMYSLCTPTEEVDYDNAIHLVAWTEVEIIN